MFQTNVDLLQTNVDMFQTNDDVFHTRAAKTLKSQTVRASALPGKKYYFYGKLSDWFWSYFLWMKSVQEVKNQSRPANNRILAVLFQINVDVFQDMLLTNVDYIQTNG